MSDKSEESVKVTKGSRLSEKGLKRYDKILIYVVMGTIIPFMLLLLSYLLNSSIPFLFGLALTFIGEPYVRNAPLRWYRQKSEFSISIGVRILAVLLASIAFISNNPLLKELKFLGPTYLVTSILLTVGILLGYILIRRPGEGDPQMTRIGGSICISFVNVSVLYVASMITEIGLFYFYGITL